MIIESFSVRPEGRNVVLSLKSPDGSKEQLENLLGQVAAPPDWTIDDSGADLNVTFSPPDEIGSDISLPVVREIGEELIGITQG